MIAVQIHPRKVGSTQSGIHEGPGIQASDVQHPIAGVAIAVQVGALGIFDHEEGDRIALDLEAGPAPEAGQGGVDYETAGVVVQVQHGVARVEVSVQVDHSLILFRDPHQDALAGHLEARAVAID